METFSEVWESSRTNAWSWGYPTVHWAGVGALVALSFVRPAWLRRAAIIIVIPVLALVAADYSSREIEEKWRLRGEWAEAHPTLMTPADLDALTTDGANRAIGPLVYGFQAFVLLSLAALAFSVVRAAILRLRRRPDGAVASGISLPTTSRSVSDNPYVPPESAR